MKSAHLNKNSIFFTINIIFIISIIIVTISMTLLFGLIQKREHFISQKKAIEISKMTYREYRATRFHISDDFKEHLLQLNYRLIDNKKEKKDILTSKDLRVHKHIKLRRNTIGFYEVCDKDYIIIFTKREPILIEDNNHPHFSGNWLIAIYLSIIFLLIVLYLTIIKKLKPITTLHQNIKKLSNEDFNITSPSDKKDEIALLANEFYHTAMKLKKIKESRNIFIRNIMHELKTPITKGKLLSEMEHTPSNNEKMKNVFLRLESLIVEFASIEELISTKKELSKKEYYLADIIDESIDLLMVDDTLIDIDFDPSTKLEIDFKLFSISIKNLIDNGIKYSKDQKVTVLFQDEKLIFTNQGEALKYPLEKYFEPFFKGDNIKSNESFGLGLYIIYHILKAHNMELSYNYNEGVNSFIITL